MFRRRSCRIASHRSPSKTCSSLPSLYIPSPSKSTSASTASTPFDSSTVSLCEYGPPSPCTPYKSVPSSPCNVFGPSPSPPSSASSQSAAMPMPATPSQRKKKRKIRFLMRRKLQYPSFLLYTRRPSPSASFLLIFYSILKKIRAMASSIAIPYKEGGIGRGNLYRRAETGIIGVGRGAASNREAIADCIEFIKRSASSGSESETVSDSASASISASDSV